MDVFELLRRHEGTELVPYCDRCGAPIVKSVNWWICKCPLEQKSPGNMTIGSGRNLIATGISLEESLVLLKGDVVVATRHLSNWQFYGRLDVVRQAAVIDLCINVGRAGFDQFRDLIAELQAGNFQLASEALRHSLAEHEEPRRIEELAQMIEFGTWPTGQY